jgi:ABC-type nitrate/sulfonate/bicarbonate transport system substrate-binding protein
MAQSERTYAPLEVLTRPREAHEVVYSVEHFYAEHPEHPLAPLMGLHRGFLQEADLQRAHLTISNTDLTAVEQVANGQVDIAMDAHPIVAMQAAARGQEIYIIGAYRNGMPFGVWARRGIQSMADLKGKRLGIIKLTDIAHRALSLVLPQFGLDPERDVEFVPRSGETLERIENLRRGFIDATVLQHELEAPFAEPYAESGEIRQIDDMARLLPAYVSRATITSGRMLRERLDAVKAFLAGVMRAHQYMHDIDPHGHEALEVVKRVLGVSTLKGSRLQNGWKVPWPTQAVDVHINREGLTAVANYYKALGKLPSDFRPETMLRADIARDVMAEWSLPTGRPPT